MEVKLRDKIQRNGKVCKSLLGTNKNSSGNSH